MTARNRLRQILNNTSFRLFTSTTLVLSTAGGLVWFRRKNQPAVDHIDTRSNAVTCDEDLPHKLANQGTGYIDSLPIEKLISLPRFEKLLIQIKLAKMRPSRVNDDLVLEELAKLSNESDGDHSDPTNPFLNDGYAAYVSQLLGDELMIQLAVKYPLVDNRFFRIEPGSTIDKLKKFKKSYQIYTDPDHVLLFQFYDEFSSNFKANAKLSSQYGKNIGGLDVKFYGNKEINKLIKKLDNDVRALIIAELIKDLPKLNVWQFDSEVNEYESSREDNNTSPDNNKDQDSLYARQKRELINRYEIFLLAVLEKMAQSSIQEFVRLGGLELLLLFYEKYKLDESMLITIGNCLNLASLRSEYNRLFVRSGWLKRLNAMCKRADHDQQASLINELIAHKIIFNLANNNNQTVLYNRMIYPLYPLYSEAVRQADRIRRGDEEHEHSVDVIFIHGLRGSVFKTWRQNDTKLKKIETKTDINVIEGTVNNVLDKLQNLIESPFNKYTYCWPRDWLPYDLSKELEKSSQSMTSSATYYDLNDRMRLLGVNYETLYSLWGEPMLDDKKLMLNIKQRAIELTKQLETCRVANQAPRPIVWVCHSMGGIIVKQMMVYLNEIKSDLLKNTRAIVFLSTPHLGSTIASTVATFSFATKPTQDILELSTNSKYLVDLNDKFLKLIRQEYPELGIVSMCEQMPTEIGILNQTTQIVTKESADLGVGEFSLVENKDHLNICKPDDLSCSVYTRIKRVIQSQIEAESNKCQQCKLDARLERGRKLQAYLFDFFKLNSVF